MLKTTILIRQADGSTRELEIVNGATVSLNGNEQLLIAADLAQAEVRAEGEGKVAVRLEGVGEFTVESEGLPPEVVAMGPDEAPAFRGQPVIVFERAGSGGDESVVHEPLGVHEASVADTAFLEQRTGEDFGMGSPLADMASFSAEAGAGLGGAGRWPGPMSRTPGRWPAWTKVPAGINGSRGTSPRSSRSTRPSWWTTTRRSPCLATCGPRTARAVPGT